MKLSKSTYLSFFFLICFLASFCANTYKNVNSYVPKHTVKHTKTASFNTKEHNTIVDNELLFEETENESENDFQAQFSILPFFISYFQFEIVKPLTFSVKPLSEKLSTPIYIAVCNFRI